MKLNSNDIKVGYKLQSFDEEDQRWYKTEVVKIVDDTIVMKDIDSNSPWQGLEFETSKEGIENIEYFKQLK